MRIAIINACHPDRQHVCAFRGTTFAEILTGSGNQVLLLTPPLTETGKGISETDLKEKLRSHDWSIYCQVSGGFADKSNLPSVRNGRVPTPIRQGIIAHNYLVRGNVYHDWIAPSSSLLPVIVDDFRPDIVWAIFGNTSCWKMGQAIARMANCPWVADIKDNWQAFVPKGLRKITARKFRDAAAYTVLSQSHAETFPLSSPVDIKTVYNGISPGLMQSIKPGQNAAVLRDEILIAGSLYRSDILAQLLQAIHTWKQTNPGTQITYAGGDKDILEQAISTLDISMKVNNLGSLSTHNLWERQQNVRMNVYVRNPPNLFHHKLLELLAAGRPVLAYPGETDESQMIAKSVNGLFFACEDENEIHQALDHSLSTAISSPDRAALDQYSSQYQADNLSQLFAETHKRFRPPA
jgi:glycosyltransferase involved in cell wall biosynthesis